LKNQLKLEAPLAVQARPGHAGFFPINKFSAVPLLIKAARGAFSESSGDDVRKRLMVVPRCHVTRLSVATDPDGRRIDAVFTERGPVPVSPDSKVILALGTIENARLALLSFGEDGKIGANLMAHLRSNLAIRVPRAAITGLAPTLKALQSSALIVQGRHPFTKPDGTPDGAVGHFYLQITATGLDNTNTNSEAELFQKVPDIDTVNQHLLATDSHVVITMRAVGEMEPGNPNSNVTRDLNPSQVDFGERNAYVNLRPTAKDMQLWDAMDKASDDVAHLFGGGLEFEVFTPHGTKKAKPAGGGQPRTDLKSLLCYAPNDDPDVTKRGRRDGLGTTHHEAGVLKMGDKPATDNSVTDENCRFHGVKNAFVAGPALFPTIGSANPMLTGIALARRLGDHLLPQPKPAAPEPGFTDLFDGTQNSADFFANWLMAEAPGEETGSQSSGGRSSRSLATGSVCSTTRRLSLTISRCAWISASATRAATSTTIRVSSSASAIRASRCCPALLGPTCRATLPLWLSIPGTKSRSTRMRAGTPARTKRTARSSTAPARSTR